MKLFTSLQEWFRKESDIKPGPSFVVGSAACVPGLSHVSTDPSEVSPVIFFVQDGPEVMMVTPKDNMPGPRSWNVLMQEWRKHRALTQEGIRSTPPEYWYG